MTGAFNMDHLQEEAPKEASIFDTAKEIVAEKVKFAPKETSPEPADDERWSFRFQHIDERGQEWAGDFTNEILTNEEHALVAALRAQMQAGLPYEALDPDVRELNLALAHLTYSLKVCPPWAKQLHKLRSRSVVSALYEKASAHEARYFRRDKAEAES